MHKFCMFSLLLMDFCFINNTGYGHNAVFCSFNYIFVIINNTVYYLPLSQIAINYEKNSSFHYCFLVSKICPAWNPLWQKNPVLGFYNEISNLPPARICNIILVWVLLCVKYTFCLVVNATVNIRRHNSKDNHKGKSKVCTIS